MGAYPNLHSAKCRNNQDLFKAVKDNFEHHYECRVITTMKPETEGQVLKFTCIGGKDKYEFLNKKIKTGYREWIDPTVKFKSMGIITMGVLDTNMALDCEDIYTLNLETGTYEYDYTLYRDEDGNIDEEVTRIMREGNHEELLRLSQLI